MKEFLAILDALRSGNPSALVTLVKVEGSSYRRAGARLLYTASGVRIGTISGGCLEEDVLLHCREVFEAGRTKKIIYDTTQENDDVWGVGLGCNGVVHLLIERLTQFPAGLEFVYKAWSRREAAVLATNFGSIDSNKLGLMLASDASGNLWTACPPEWLASLSIEANRALHTQRSFVKTFPGLPHSPEAFFEYLPPPTALLIFGAGDDARPLARLAAELGWEISIADPRADYATQKRFPEAKQIVVAPVMEATKRLHFDNRTAAVVMTHHYVHDLPFTRELLPKPIFYLGLLGPKKRTERLLTQLQSEGLVLTGENRARLHGPVGLDLGANTPEEVALSVLAEIQAVLQGRNGRPLRERELPIHD